LKETGLEKQLIVSETLNEALGFGIVMIPLVLVNVSAQPYESITFNFILNVSITLYACVNGEPFNVSVFPSP